MTDPTAAGYVDMTNHTINVGPHSMLTGDPVTYLNAGGDSIGGPLLGLVNGQTYYVIRLAGQPDEIQVAQSLSDALLGNPYLFGELYLPDLGTYLGPELNPSAVVPPGIPTNATVATKTFDGSAIDPSGNTITVSLGRATGSGIAFNLFGVALNAAEPVFYHYNGPANTAILGLVDGAEYWVDVPEDQYDPNGTNALLHATDSETVSLAPSYTASEYGSTVDFGCPATIVTGGPCGGTGYSLVPAHYLSSVGASGLGIGANLTPPTTPARRPASAILRRRRRTRCCRSGTR